MIEVSEPMPEALVRELLEQAEHRRETLVTALWALEAEMQATGPSAIWVREWADKLAALLKDHAG